MLISTGPFGSKLLARTAASDPCWKRRLRPGWSALRTQRTRSPGVLRWPITSAPAGSRRRNSSCGTPRRRSQPTASRTTRTPWTANHRRDRPPVPGGAGAGGRARASEAPRGLDGAAPRADPRPPGSSAPTGTPFLRLRVGDLRVVYLVDDAHQLVVVLRVARRAESTYRRLQP